MLSATPEGKLWLKQFDAVDMETATLLLDSIILVDQADFETSLEKALDGILSRHKGKIAIYGAVERPKLAVDGNPWKRVIDTSKPFFPEAISGLNPKREPEVYAPPRNLGSEGDLAHFCRDYARARKRVLSHPGLETLREKKVRWLVFMDDIVGSGNRMKEFVEWVYEDKTIKSWHSLKWIKFIILAYSASSVGLKVIEKIPTVCEIEQCRALMYGRDSWSESELYNIEALCKRYSRKYKLGMPLGYKNAFSMILFPHGGPNTNPSILMKGKGEWKPLIQGTGRPVSVIKKVIPKENQQLRLLKVLGQTRLTKPSLFQRLDHYSKTLLLLLSCIAMKKRTVFVLSEMLGVSNFTVQDLLLKCKNLYWIDDKTFLTPKGKCALEAARRNKCTEGKDLTLKMDFYFPSSLRSPAVASSVASLKQGES